jgi:hypothetical protein
MDQEQPTRKRDRRSRLTEEDVAQIKAHLQQGKRLSTLARHFRVNHQIIGAIRDNKTWRHVAPAVNATPLSKLSNTASITG